MPTLRPVRLSQTDQGRLSVFLQRGKANVRTLKRAQILLKLDAGWSTAQVAEAYAVHPNTVTNLRTRYLTGGLDAVLTDRQQLRRRAALTGAQQAHLIAIACSPVPEGHDHWTLRMLAGQAVELGYVEHIDIGTIRNLLKKTRSNPGSTSTGACPA
ncbi:MAG TPA: helix-turn-helix domain-containing protein [Ktedonobacterales bacterium]